MDNITSSRNLRLRPYTPRYTRPEFKLKLLPKVLFVQPQSSSRVGIFICIRSTQKANFLYRSRQTNKQRIVATSRRSGRGGRRSAPGALNSSSVLHPRTPTRRRIEISVYPLTSPRRAQYQQPTETANRLRERLRERPGESAPDRTPESMAPRQGHYWPTVISANVVFLWSTILPLADANSCGPRPPAYNSSGDGGVFELGIDCDASTAQGLINITLYRDWLLEFAMSVTSMGTNDEYVKAKVHSM